MAFTGYFEYAGTEIINVARTAVYVGNQPWFRGCMDFCDLQAYLGDSDYTTPQADEAPWYDPVEGYSGGFYGVYPIDVEGIENGTGTAAVTESILNGGVVGRVRYATKSVVFNVALMGQDECATETGFRWLKRALAGTQCVDRGGSYCAGDNLCYFSCVPCLNPDCAGTPDVVLRTNWSENPSAEFNTNTGLTVVDTSINPGAYRVGNEPPLPGSPFPGGGQYFVYTSRSAAALDLNISRVRTSTVPITPGKVATFGIDVQAPDLPDSRFLSGFIEWRDGSGTIIQTDDGLIDLSISSALDTYRGVCSGTAPAGAASVSVRWEVTVDGGATFDGERVFYDRQTWEVGDAATDGSYFDGDTTDIGNLVYDWTGIPQASPSTLTALGSSPLLPSTDPACEGANLRSLRNVTIITGPTVTAKRIATNGASIWTATFTAVAGNPFEYSQEQRLIEGFMDPAVDVPWAGGEVPDGGSWDDDGFPMEDDPEGCVRPTYQPIFDPDGSCTIVSLPPGPPTIASCADFPLDYTRRQFVIPPQYIPVWGDIVPKFEIHARFATVRNLRIRFYPDHYGAGDTTIDPCNYCGDVVVSYIPKGDTLVFDGSDETTFMVSTAGSQQRCDHLLFSSDGTPFDWPALTCGTGFVVTVDTPIDSTPPVLDMSLYDRVV